MHLDEDSLALISNNMQDSKKVGLGSGATIARLISFLHDKRILNKKAWYFPSSMQIAYTAMKYIENIAYPQLAGQLDLTLDGADNVLDDKTFIKGGGGALLMEKILWSASKKIIVFVTEDKMTKPKTIDIPLEVHRNAALLVSSKLREKGYACSIRQNEKGYPSITENGNLILDVNSSPENITSVERYVSSMPGVMETGIFKFDNVSVIVVDR
ncbi:MAG: ribose 5-phosphate isomerase A [Nitrososphaerota archaeon]